MKHTPDFRFLIFDFRYLLICLTIFSVNAIAQDNSNEDSLNYKTETIDVDALKGIERSTPVTFENIEKKQHAISLQFYSVRYKNGYSSEFAESLQ